MLLYLLAYFGGVLTILSPCILPVLPFVFARSDQPFRKSGLPLLIGMAATFTLVAGLATVGGGWAIRANQFGRIAALVLFGFFGLTLLFSSLAERLSRPLVQLGARFLPRQESSGSGWNSFFIGIGTGLLWTPCAGPILGLILTAAALSGASAKTVILLLIYAAGAATSLAVALFAGGRAFRAMKGTLGAELWIRRSLGLAVLAGVAVAALGLDRGILTRFSLANTSGVEQRLLNLTHAIQIPTQKDLRQVALDKSNDAGGLPALLPDLSGATAWINSAALTPDSLRGKVVLVDFWTYSCINCLRTLPTIRAWHEKYKDSGLVVIGVHTPEFPFEKDEANVRKAIHDLGIAYPVAMDNDYRIWRGFHNEYWPAHYFIDATGHIRFHAFGEGHEEQSEGWIRTLLQERNHQPAAAGAVHEMSTGAGQVPGQTAGQTTGQAAEQASDLKQIQSPETYVGYARAMRFTSPGGFNEDVAALYRAPAQLALNDWALIGRWKDEAQIATLHAPAGAIVYRFHARDLHLVLGPASKGKPIRFRITLDGKAPGEDHGADTDAEGYGTVTSSRLYQLVRQKSPLRDRTFRIEFPSPGVQAFAFTFG